MRVRLAETDLESGTGVRLADWTDEAIESVASDGVAFDAGDRHTHDTQALEEGSRNNLAGPGYRLSSLPFALNQSSVVDNPSSRLMGL